MAGLYADEQFPRVVVELLRALGHDVLTVQEASHANLGIPDEDVLAFAVTKERAVLTLNRIDFIRLHASQPNHAGIIVCKDDQQDRQRMATRISEAISNVETLRGMLVRVNRPSQ
jgi:predicted nuclease of predicted toxin-antitoxin system